MPSRSPTSSSESASSDSDSSFNPLGKAPLPLCQQGRKDSSGETVDINAEVSPEEEEEETSSSPSLDPQEMGVEDSTTRPRSAGEGTNPPPAGHAPTKATGEAPACAPGPKKEKKRKAPKMAPRKETEEEKSERQAKEGKKLPWHTPGTARGRSPSVQILPSEPPAPPASFGGFNGTVRVAQGEQPGTSGDPTVPPTGEYDRLVDILSSMEEALWALVEGQRRILESLPHLLALQVEQ
ncbi:hypothetical protein GPALN_004189 [Globodera pallida]|nr:hypothetical protein GPALN_004189 [Globodera pallida]